MAVTQTQNLPPQYIEDLSQDYATQLKGLTSIPLDTGRFAPKIAPQDQYQQDAYTLGGQGVGAYQPYLTQAGAYATPTGYESFMSPYQQDIIDTTMSDFDKQAAQGILGIGQAAAQTGNLGGGREGVMRSEYQSQSDLNRAKLLAQLRQQGFGQAQQLAHQGYQQQMQMGQQLPSWQAGDISQLGQLGGVQQAQAQAELGATQEANRLTAMEPYERLGQYGTGVTGLIQGVGNQYQTSVMPNPTPLQTALGTASVLGGIYGNIGTRQGSPQTTTTPTQLGTSGMNMLSGTYPWAPPSMGSDARLKTDIESIGQSPAGVNVYSFKYKGDDKTYQGVMAQEVPWASIKGDDGYYRVDYSKVDVEFKRLL